jgi:hypothetical protein
MGLPGMVLSAMAAVAGAIMYWAVTYQGTGFRLSTVETPHDANSSRFPCSSTGSQAKRTQKS